MQTSAAAYYTLTVIIIQLHTMNVIYTVILAPHDTLNTVGIGQYICMTSFLSFIYARASGFEVWESCLCSVSLFGSSTQVKYGDPLIASNGMEYISLQR